MSTATASASRCAAWRRWLLEPLRIWGTVLRVLTDRGPASPRMTRNANHAVWLLTAPTLPYLRRLGGGDWAFSHSKRICSIDVLLDVPALVSPLVISSSVAFGPSFLEPRESRTIIFRRVAGSTRRSRGTPFRVYAGVLDARGRPGRAPRSFSTGVGRSQDRRNFSKCLRTKSQVGCRVKSPLQGRCRCIHEKSAVVICIPLIVAYLTRDRRVLGPVMSVQHVLETL